MIRRWTSNRGREVPSWPLLLLVVVVVVPTLGILWFMLAAMENERSAVRQRLQTAYRAQLSAVKRQLLTSFEQQAAELDRRGADTTCAALFAAVVRAGEADSLICLGTAPGTEYPRRPAVARPSPAPQDGAWKAAARLERGGGFERAAEDFSRIARQSSDDARAARALQAQARCLIRAGRRDAALRVLREELTRPRYRSAVDLEGRRIVPNAALLILQLADEAGDEPDPLAVAALRERLNDYGEPVMSSPQRRFLMRGLRELLGTAQGLDTLAAEDLAARYLDASGWPSVGEPAAPPTFRRGEPDGVWQLVSPSGRIVSLHTEAGLRKRLARRVAGMGLPAEMTAEVLPPGLEGDPSGVAVSFAPGEPLAGWRLALALDDEAQIDAAVRRQITVYLWTGVLVIFLIIAATSVIARAVGRQIRSTRLKNDLLANVSHELKTPLSSMRLLVDTLLGSPSSDGERLREYLELISQENLRLSRLVDNFLSFSRMERNKETFERAEIASESVVDAATSALGERFRAPGCHFEVELAPGLPKIYADSDAMVTVLLNLLDNAYKYSGDDKQITLRAYADDGEVSFAVCDNGIGLSSRQRRRVFERFYQADRDLTRHGGGCGLGLAIVRFIVGAHGGSVDVQSRLHAGSTFTVRLPAVGAGE